MFDDRLNGHFDSCLGSKLGDLFNGLIYRVAECLLNGVYEYAFDSK